MNPIRPTLLVVEDNDDDVFLLRRALRGIPNQFDVQIAADGQQAVDYLAGAGDFADRAKFPRPALMLLDLKLPFLHGFQVLEWVRAQPAWKELPVVILTSSAEERDQEQAAQFGVRAYHVKPPQPALLDDIAHAIADVAMSAR
jgi:CheY-like chemotaxis protein